MASAGASPESNSEGSPRSAHQLNGVNDHHMNGISDAEDDDDAGLFGPDSDNEQDGSGNVTPKRRKLDDRELDSGDDAGRDDRVDDEMDGYSGEEKSEVILDVEITRHGIPKPTDGEVHLLQLPNHIGIEPTAFMPSTFQPPTTDHHSNEAPSVTFSASQTANNTIRWKRPSTKSSQMQSNSRILRWSDGSYTLQIASNAREQFQLTSKPLAVKENAPPTSSYSSARREIGNRDAIYDSRLDSHTYLATAQMAASLIQITNHITSSLSVQSSRDQEDDALIQLQKSLAAAKGDGKTADGGVEMINISEDPELAKKKAEIAEKEKVRAQRRRQVQEDRERDRANRVLGRSGLRASYGGASGLTVGGLEDELGGTSKSRGAAKPKKRPRRRTDDYSDEEEDYGRGRTREDEYDVDDDFLVGSDEDPEVVEESEEEEADEGLDDEDEAEDNARSKKKTVDVAAGEARVERGKRRRVIEDEDEE